MSPHNGKTFGTKKENRGQYLKNYWVIPHTAVRKSGKLCFVISLAYFLQYLHLA
jgi:hypothetical protein